MKPYIINGLNLLMMKNINHISFNYNNYFMILLYLELLTI